MQNNYLLLFFSACSYGSPYKVLLDKTFKAVTYNTTQNVQNLHNPMVLNTGWTFNSCKNKAFT